MALPLDFCDGASGLGSCDARRRECGQRKSGVHAGGGARSAGEERRAARLIFQVSGCRREGIGDGVQAGGRGRECRRVLSRDSRVQIAASGIGRAGGRESERLSAGGQ